MTLASRLLAILAVSVAGRGGAQERLSVDGSVRGRVEIFDGQARAGARESDRLLLFRSELLVEYDAGDVRVGAELIDSRVYLDRADTVLSTSEVNAFEPSQAWIAADLKERTTLTAGRFNLNLGSRRLLSRNGYRNTVNSFTGARLDLGLGEQERLTLFWTMPHARLPDDRDGLRSNEVALDRERDELQTFGAYLVNKPTGIGAVDLFAIGLTERDAPGFRTRNRRLGTVGGRVRQAPNAGRLDYEAEAAWQFGRSRGSAADADVADRDVSAWMLQLIAGYTWDVRWSPRLVASLDMASGDGPGSEQGRFDTLYGSRSFEFGPTSLFGFIARANIVSPALRLEATPSERMRAHVTARPIWLEERTDSFGMTGVRDPAGQSGRFVGTQVDGRVQYWIVPDRVQLGFWTAYFDKGRFLRTAPNAPRSGDGVYGATEITFRF